VNDLTVDTAEAQGPLSKREQQKEAKRKALISAALAVFSRVGFAGAKMEDVAEEAGVSKGTVYLYFDSKDHLFEEMVRANAVPMLDHNSVGLSDQSISATERLKTLIKFFYRKVLNSERRQIMRLIMAEGPNFPHLAEFYYTNILSRGHAMIDSVIEQGIENGEFRKLNEHGLAQNVVAGAIVASIWKMVFEPFQSIDLDAYSDTHVDLILNGLNA